MKDERLRKLAAKAGLPWWVNIDDALLGESLERFARIVEEEKEKQMKDEAKDSSYTIEVLCFICGAAAAAFGVWFADMFAGRY